MGAVQISEQVGRVPCPCSGPWEMIGHHGVTLICRLAQAVLPPSSKGLSCCKGSYCHYYFQSSGNFTYNTASAALPDLVGCASATQQRASKKRAPWWKACAIAARPWGESFVFLLLGGWRVTRQSLSWGWTWCSGCCWLKSSVMKAASTEDQGGLTPVPTSRDISLAPTRHLNLNCWHFL